MFSKLTNIFYGSKKTDYTKNSPKLLSFSINYEKVFHPTIPLTFQTQLAVGTTKGFRIYDINNDYDVISIREGENFDF